MPPEFQVVLPKIPEAKSSDPEDVSWALTTAEAMWARGDHLEGIKWVRKAAEAASVVNNDGRALELAKEASRLAGIIARRSTTTFTTNESATAKRNAPDDDEWEESPTKRAPGESTPDLSANGDRKTTAFAVPVAPAAPAARPTTTNVHDAALKTSQAVRVVVWRDANGVHVAPAGTVVSAISIEAVLVALEGGADLTAWLSQRAR